MILPATNHTTFEDICVNLNNERNVNVLLVQSAQKHIRQLQTSTGTTVGVDGTCSSKSGGKSYTTGILRGDISYSLWLLGLGFCFVFAVVVLHN